MLRKTTLVGLLALGTALLLAAAAVAAPGVQGNGKTKLPSWTSGISTTNEWLVPPHPVSQSVAGLDVKLGPDATVSPACAFCTTCYTATASGGASDISGGAHLYLQANWCGNAGYGIITSGSLTKWATQTGLYLVDSTDGPWQTGGCNNGCGSWGSDAEMLFHENLPGGVIVSGTTWDYITVYPDGNADSHSTTAQ